MPRVTQITKDKNFTTQKLAINESTIEKDNVSLLSNNGNINKEKQKERVKMNKLNLKEKRIISKLAKDQYSNESILEQANNNEISKKPSKKRKINDDLDDIKRENILLISKRSKTGTDTGVGTGTGTDCGLTTISKVSDDVEIIEESKRVLTPSESQELISFTMNFPGLDKQYKVLQKIGEGTFSSVYLAKPISKKLISKGIKTTVALKRIYVTSSPQRIHNELNLLYNLRGHPNVAPLIDVLRYEDQVIAVLPYYEHADFRDFYRDLPLAGIKKYMYDLFRALRFIHKKNIMHRDIKPTNFLYNPLTRRGILVDFGLAETYIENTTSQCPCLYGGYTSNALIRLNNESPFPKNGYLKDDQRPGRRANRAGTRGFRAPEVLFKCNNQSEKIDIWSAGVMLLTLLSRRFPFFNSTDDIEAIIEITSIFGIKEMRKVALLHGLEFNCNVPRIREAISFEALISNAVLMDCKEGDTFAEDSPAWELLSAIDKRGEIQNNLVGKEYKEAIDVLKKTMMLNPFKRFDARKILKMPFFDDVRDEKGEYKEYLNFNYGDEESENEESGESEGDNQESDVEEDEDEEVEIEEENYN